MAALHTALRSLSLTPFSSVPADETEAVKYLRTAFSDAQLVIDSVPLPPPAESVESVRPRSSTSGSTASNVSEISSSSARSEPLDPSHIVLQKEWSKPVKLNAKDNPLGIAVYKLGGKDGRGAWFARRSVHEGLGFKKWKLGLQREFPETLEVRGGPGEGNIRGIGGERRVERKSFDGVGNVEVYHLSAQFPGPTTPRDFVTLLLTSSSAICEHPSSRPSSPASDGAKAKPTKLSEHPRHFMVISRPCEHPECPPRDGFIRGQYESVEFIREIPQKLRKSASATDLTRDGRTSPSIEKEAMLRSAMHKPKPSAEYLPNGDEASAATINDTVKEGRSRGRTISFAGSRGVFAKGEAMDTPRSLDDEEINPVEWIMITRSDPGGSVPRFMVERGTPGGIVADASKFLDWACKKEHPEDEVEALDSGDTQYIRAKKREELEAYETNGHLAGLDGSSGFADAAPSSTLEANSTASVAQETQSGGLLSIVANVAYAGLETYAPQSVIDRLPGRQQSSSPEVNDMPSGVKSMIPTPSISSASSTASFASAEAHFDDTSSTKSTTSQTKSSSSKSKEAMSAHEKELAKLNRNKQALNEKLAKAREKEMKDKEELTSKEEERVRKAEEKHAREIAKQEEKYKKEVAKLEAKRQKEVAKDQGRRRRAEEKDEKVRLNREKEEMKQELEVAKKERDILREQVGALQRENTTLVVRMGKMEEGKDVLKEIKVEVDGGNRSRSGSVRKEKALEAKSKGATILGGDKKEALDAMQ